MKNPARSSIVRVLLVEDSLPIRQRVRSLIEESGAATIVGEAGTVATALARFYELKPDAVVLDLHLVEGSGYVVLKAVKKSRPNCMVIVLTNFSTPENEAHCRFLGADHFLEKSREFERVPEILAGLGGAVPPAGRILIADAEVMAGKALGEFLAAAGYDCTWVMDAAAALQAVRRSRYDLLIADGNMPGNRQMELLSELSSVAPGLPVILLTGNPTAGPVGSAVQLPAATFLVKPPDLAVLKSLVREAIANHQVHQAVQTQWDQFETLYHDLNLHRAVSRQTGAEDADEVQELERLFQAVSSVIRAGSAQPAPEVLPVAQQRELVGAVRVTIAVLAQTKPVFKSVALGDLRVRLAALVAGLDLEPQEATLAVTVDAPAAVPAHAN